MSETVLEPEVRGPESHTGRWMVTIYNNDYTPVDMVVLALVRATACCLQEARTEVWEAEQYGHAAVHFGDKPECDHAAEIIRSIGVRTEVSREWED